MYVESVPNRNSPPAILLRESFREGGKVRKRTLANLSKLPSHVIDGLKALLRGGVVVEDLSDAFELTQSLPFGHVFAALGTARKIGLDKLLAPNPCPERDLVLAMIVARVLSPASKLATVRGLDQEGHLAALGQELGLQEIHEDRLYAALDWLFVHQADIERRLAARHLEGGSLVLYDVTSTYFEGRCCPLAAHGHSRDHKSNKQQIVFGLLCNRDGCPVAVEVFPGNTGDPSTLKPQVDKVRQRFGLERVIFVGDRGLLTAARVREELEPVPGLSWITALRFEEIRQLESLSGLQLSLFDERGFVELSDSNFPGERLVVCRNPLLVEERARKRQDLLQATEAALERIAAATQRERRPLRDREKIALRVGKVLGRFKVAKHFLLDITDTSFSYRRDQDRIAAEAALDGFYVIRTNVAQAELPAEDSVRSYKRLSTVERAFRAIKTVDLNVRPIHHYLAERVRAHVFLCMLAYYLEWHLRQNLAPLLFDDEDPATAQMLRPNVVAPAQVSPGAKLKAETRRNTERLPVHSFRGLLKVLGTLSKNRFQPRAAPETSFEKLSRPTPVQEKAFSLLGLSLQSTQ